MSTRFDDTLVVLAPKQSTDHLARCGRIVSQASRRVLTLARNPGVNVEDIQKLPGVVWAGQVDPPGTLLAGLEDTERLFVAAWLQRQSKHEEQRAHEGVAWDAAGFQPPDPPKRH